MKDNYVINIEAIIQWFFIGAIIIGLFLLFCSPFIIRGVTYKENVEIEAVGTERICSTTQGTDIECIYIVFTDIGTLKNVDDMLAWKYNSSEVQGMFKKGGCFSVTLVGFRSTFFSRYPNVLKAEPMECSV